MLEHLHENGWGVGRGPKLVIRFSMDLGVCVVCAIFYFFSHTDADELKGSVKRQLLKLALYTICLPDAETRNKAWRKGSLWARGTQVAVEKAVLTPSDGQLGNRTTELILQSLKIHSPIPHIIYEEIEVTVSKPEL